MQKNAHFIKGHGHDICEDYCIAGKAGRWHYAIGADGCSSSPGSDFGSRLLCHGMRTIIKESDKNFLLQGNTGEIEVFLRTQMVSRLREAKTSFNIKRTVLDSTLLVALACNERHLFFMWGDGLVVIRRKNSVEILDMTYTSGAPPYLSYEMEHGDVEAYEAQFGNTPRFLHRHYIDRINRYKFSRKLTDNYYAGEIFHDPDNPLESISIFSDGLHSFEGESAACITAENLAGEYTSFPNKTGEFVIRRMKKMERQHHREGITHYDDLFCGSIIFEEKEASHEGLHERKEALQA